jgi:signal peptidase II
LSRVFYKMIKRLSSWPVVSLCGAFVFLLDFITKKLVIDYLPQAYAKGLPASSTIVIFHNFLGIDLSITHTTNTGAAWGFFGEYPYVLLALRFVLILCLAYYLFCTKPAQKFRLPLMFILSGALGNICDFFLYGHVIDMIHFVFFGHDYPVFNVADSFIFIGTFTILFLLLFESKNDVRD